MWSFASGAIATVGAVVSKALPYLFSATLGALVFKQPEHVQSYSGPNGTLIQGAHVTTHIHQIQQPTSPPSVTTSWYGSTKPLFLAGGGLTLIYCIIVLKRGESILSSPDSWVTWLRDHSYNEEELLYEVHLKYCGQTYDQLEPCLAAFDAVMSEKETLQNYLSLRSFIAKTPLTIFLYHHTFIQEQAKTSIEQLDTLSHQLLTWTRVLRKEKVYEEDISPLHTPE